MDYKNISVRLYGQEIGTIKQYKHMTEQGLIEYAKAGDERAIAHLAGHGFEGVDWSLAITHVNGGWLPGVEIKRVWSEMVKINQATAMSMDDISRELQKALNQHHARVPVPALVTASPAGRPWDFKTKAGFKFGRSTNRKPPKKKRKK